MAVSEKKKASNAKWDSANMTTLGCRVKKSQAEAFKAHCETQGSTSNTVLKDFVLDCIGEQESGMTIRTPQEAAGAAGVGGILVSPDTLAAAQRAAERTGEAVPDFVARAVDTQAQRDKTALRMGVNPATGEKLNQGTEGGTDHE